MTETRSEFSIAWVLTALVRHTRLTVGVPLVTAVVAAIISLVVRSWYTASVAFVPEVRTPTGVSASLLGLASQFGVSLGGQSIQTPQFYSEVLRSRALMTAVLETRFALPGAPSDTAVLLDWLRVNGRTPAVRTENGIKALSKRIAIDVDFRTGIVRLNVDAPDPVLARDVAIRFMELVNEFNLERRSSQARERRRFVEARAMQADSQLRDSEDALRRFYEANRQWQQSPALIVLEGRMRRQVQLRQELQLTLAREAETARIEEVNDTPVITVLDPPTVPQRRSSPRRKVVVVAALIAGTLVGVALALIFEVRTHLVSEADPDYLNLAREARRARERASAALNRVLRPR